ncbi:uncharacterized protein LOC124275578 [Haliotis rubra]|uniref:uncharacterized protein LOC124275578 n=1 Tax=Haliotis rubra TaxID=36100 RepID=UPI001EE5C1E7|nr:uncharacterized protein LOC124275578 [Haliotis rubra]XP_046567126.1 uncharacterized protein LOC124275578 [Haliotis rubra]
MLRTILYRKKTLIKLVLAAVTLMTGEYVFLKRHNIHPVRKHGITTEPKFKYFYGPSRVPFTSEKDFLKPKYDKKYFIYDCSQQLCGGLGDRQEGILAAYLISQLMGRQFGVILTIPCDVTNILDENDDKWMIPPGSLTDLTVLPYKVLDRVAWNLRENIHTIELEQRFTQDVILFTVNQEFVKYLMKLPRFRDLKWAQNKTAVDIYNIVLRRLFKLKPKYQEQFDNFQTSVRANGRKLVCAHIRLHQSITEHKVYIDKIFDFLRQYNNSATYRMFVATNSEQVREESRRMFPKVIVDIDGPLVHVDMDTGGKACDGFGKALLDQQILSTCDIYLMSDSGFGRVAAMLRGTDDNLYSPDGKVSFNDANFMPPHW